MASYSLTAESFEKSLEKFRQRHSKQIPEFSLSNLDDVKDEIRKIQDRLGPEKKLRGLNRVKKFLEGMKQVEQLVQIFLNTSEVVAYVWGPIKLALMVASTRIETLERLLSVYQDIGEVLHGVGKYDKLFQNYPDFRRILEIYFYDILEFHHEVLKVFAKPDWRRFLDYAWPTFKTKFEPIIDSLKRHRDLLAGEQITVILEELQEFRSSNDRVLSILQDLKAKLDQLQKGTDEKKREVREQILKKREIVQTKLRIQNYDEDYHIKLKKRAAPSSGNWIFEDPTFKAWLYGNTEMDSILYINGIPGSGKTILVSTIVDYVLRWGRANKGVVLFFYCRDHGGKETCNTKSDMFRALLMQLASQNDTLLEYISHKCVDLAGSGSISEPFLEEILKDCFNNLENIRIIFDALDESEQPDEIDTYPIITWLKEAVLLTGPCGPRARFLVSGQRNGVIDSVLSGYPDIDLDKVETHRDDIKAYISSKIPEISSRFKLGMKEKEDVVKRVTDGSKGMFLYAKIVLDNLFHQQSLAKFKKELSQDNFPKELNQAYERVAIRVFDHGHEARRLSAATILGWIATSGRPLRSREIQARFCINPVDEICDFDERMLDPFKIICGSLVEAEACDDYKESEPEQIISIVHPTAGRYLAESGRIQILEQHVEAAKYFSRYLTSTPFQGDLAEDRIRELALCGYYSLQDYACAFWHHHIRSALNWPSNIPQDYMSAILDCAVAFIKISKTTVAHSEALTEDENPQETTKEAVLQTINGLYAPGAGESALSLQTKSIRNIIESISRDRLEVAQLEILEGLHGFLRYKCPQIACSHFSKGFHDREERDCHIQEHERPFKCPKPECLSFIIGFSSASLLSDHTKRLHTSNPALLFPRGKESVSATIHAAASRGDLEAVIAFHRVDPSSLLEFDRQNKEFPLQTAARRGHLAICEYIIQQHIYAEVMPYHGFRVVKAAIKNDDLQLFELLKYNIKDLYGQNDRSTHLGLAIRHNSEKILEVMLKDFEYQESLSAKLTDIHYLEADLVNNLRISNWGSLAQDCAKAHVSKSDALERQKQLIHKFLAKIFPSFHETEKVTLEVESPTVKRQEDIDRAFHFLYEIPPNRRGESSLLGIALTCSTTPSYALVECVLDLLDSIIQNSTVKVVLEAKYLHYLAVAQSRNKDWLKICLRRVASRLITITDPKSINNEDFNGSSLLHATVAANNYDLLEILIPAIDDLDKTNDLGQTALEIAAKKVHRESVKLLIESDRINSWQTDTRGRDIIMSQDGNWYICPEIIDPSALQDGNHLQPICDYRNALLGPFTDDFDISEQDWFSNIDWL
ncbi:hypothetical protein TWF718_009863 [Orbilia javanica]|uniref:NACHT domain-containing protein n=1 Tax=Orbilia javanica TaxID=47235 RepID=A0AAN8RBS1_9PEZI